MSLTLNDLIAAAVTGAEAAEEEAANTQVKVASAPPAPPAVEDDFEDVEKLASVLENLGRRGLANVLGTEKTAKEHCPECGRADCKCPAAKSKECPECGKAKCKCPPMGKKAGHTTASSPPSGTNDGPPKKESHKSQVGPHKGAPSMKEPGYGQIPNNGKGRPGSGGSPDTSSNEKGTHHKSLASNEAAISMTKKEKTKRTSPALNSLLSATPYSDNKHKESLSHPETDKNIHSKKAHDEEAIKAELARRLAAGRA
jgi:hypothetical protein